ncbi:MAG: PQQ-binding-like beta-propeller repeat protein [Pirellulales bacterium]
MTSTRSFLVCRRLGDAFRAARWAVLAAVLANTDWAAAQSELVPQNLARRVGLERAWVSQVQMDKTKYKVTGTTLSLVQDRASNPEQHDLLLLQTNHGFLQALDAENGRTVWQQQIGDRDFLNLPAASSDKVVVVLNGQVMLALDRSNGHVLWEKRLLRVPSQQPAVDSRVVHVPHFSGHVTSYQLPNSVANVETDEIVRAKEERVYLSFGSIDVPPLFTRQSLAWATSRGFVFVASPDLGSVRFRFETNRAISAPLAYWTPLVLAASRDGYLYAIDEMSGEARWQFTTGHAIGQRPAAIDGAVYITPDIGGMYCLGVDAGLERWFVPRITQFVAASKDRVYATDNLQRLVVLDAASGGQLAQLPIDPLAKKLMNTQNDRIYMVTAGGLVQCLHEIGAAQPIVHVIPEPVAPQDKFKKGKKPKKAADDEDEDAEDEDEDAREDEGDDEDADVEDVISDVEEMEVEGLEDVGREVEGMDDAEDPLE